MGFFPAEVFRDPIRRSLSLDGVAEAGNGRKHGVDEELLAIRRSQSFNDLRATRKHIPVLFQRSSDAQVSTAQTENEVSKSGLQHPKPHTPADKADSKAQNNLFENFLTQKVFSRPSFLSRSRSPSAGKQSPEESHISRNQSLSKRSGRMESDEVLDEYDSKGKLYYDGLSNLANYFDSNNRSASQPPTLRYKRRDQPLREHFESLQPHQHVESGVPQDLELFWTNNLNVIKERESKRFEELFGSLRITDEQWMIAFDLYRNTFLELADKIIQDINFEEVKDSLENTQFRGTPSDVLINTARNLIRSIKYSHTRQKKYRDIQLEVWLTDRLWKAFRDEFVRSKVGSKEDFDQKWESLSDQYPDMENELGIVLDACEGHLRKWICPKASAKDARTVLESVTKDHLQLKAYVLLSSGINIKDSFIVISAVSPNFGAILERIHTLDKKMDRVLYGLPVGKKSRAFLASQELDVIEYLKHDEVNVNRRSIFAAVDFGLSDRSIGAQVSKSARKAKLYYDLILEASSMDEQSWLHEQLSKSVIGLEDKIDVRFVDRKWKTLQDFFKNAGPKAKRISDLCQPSRSNNAERSFLRRRHVRRPSRSESLQERTVPENPSSDTPINVPNAEGLSTNARREKSVIKHLLSFIRHVRQTPSRKVVLSFIVDRKTVLALMPCFTALSAVFTGVSLMTNSSDPNTSNFYEQLSTLSQVLFSLYCLMVPLIRASNPIAWSFWLSLAVSMSAVAGVLSVVLFYYNGQASISFSFVSGTAQIVATMLLIEGVDEVVRRPRREFAMSARDVSLGSEDEINRNRYRSRDEEAFGFALPARRPEPILRDVFYERRRN